MRRTRSGAAPTDERENSDNQISASNRRSDLKTLGYFLLPVAIFFAAIAAWAVFEIVTGVQLVGGPDDN